MNRNHSQFHDEYEFQEEISKLISKIKNTKKFLDVPVEWRKVSKIVDIARSAPSMGELQPINYIIVQDQKKRTRISTACLEKHWMSEAPVHIVVTTNPELLEKYYGKEGKRKYSIQEASMSAMIMMIMAKTYNLSSCWVNTFDEEQLKKVLDVRSQNDIHGILTIGYSNDDSPRPRKKELEQSVSLETAGPHFANYNQTFSYEYRLKDRVPNYVKKTYEDYKKVKENKPKEDSETILDKLKKKFKK